MSKSVTNGHELSVARDPSPHPDEIRRQLQRILASPVFHGSKRCQQFLEYVCVKSLAGENGALKERTVAVEVFGRPPHIDLPSGSYAPEFRYVTVTPEREVPPPAAPPAPAIVEVPPAHSSRKLIVWG